MGTYEEYIDSGIDWVGFVPSNWRQTQLKYISSISKGRKAKEEFQDFNEGMIPYLSTEYLRSQTKSPFFVFADDPNIVLVEEQDYSFKPTLDGDNFIQQAYNHLKTLPEFAGSTDC